MHRQARMRSCVKPCRDLEHRGSLRYHGSPRTVAELARLEILLDYRPYPFVASDAYRSIKYAQTYTVNHDDLGSPRLYDRKCLGLHYQHEGTEYVLCHLLGVAQPSPA
ncbi:hypothetical protein ACMFMG_008829 [Clarireedia jacksonii]